MGNAHYVSNVHPNVQPEPMPIMATGRRSPQGSRVRVEQQFHVSRGDRAAIEG